jgi:GxxExxY protein
VFDAESGMLELNEERGGYETGSYKHSELTQRIIHEFYAVYNALGYGFLEKVYENALALRLRNCGITVRQQQPISVHFEGYIVGEYFADMVVDDLVLVELKAAADLSPEHEAQLLNYLKATKYEVGLLLNFGPKPRINRKIFENHLKPNLKRS